MHVLKYHILNFLSILDGAYWLLYTKYTFYKIMLNINVVCTITFVGLLVFTVNHSFNVKFENKLTGIIQILYNTILSVGRKV